MVAPFAKALREVGLKTWVDIEDIHPGDNWSDAITGALNASSVLILCISPLALKSGRIQMEIQSALKRGITVIPVMVERMPIDSLPAEITQFHILMMCDRPMKRAPRLAAQEIASALGLPGSECLREPNEELFDALVVRISDDDWAPTADTLTAITGHEFRSLLFHSLDSLDPSIMRDLGADMGRATSAVVAVGRDARELVVGMVLGLASTIVGARRAPLQSSSSHS
jgi:hypothetical protein